MFQGKSPYATQGEHAGQEMHAEHIVPYAVVPEMDNLLMNLEWLPESVNSAKSDTITERAWKYAQRYHGVGILQVEDFLRVKDLYEKEKK